MTQDHAFHVLLQRPDKTPVEEALVAAITILSVEQYRASTPEEIFDSLVAEFRDTFGGRTDDQAFLHMLYRRILRMEQSLLNQLHKQEKTLAQTSTAVTRLQADNDALKKLTTDLQSSFATFAQGALDAYARFQKSLDDLKNAAGDEDAVNAVAADMEANVLPALQALKDQATAAGATAGGEDQPATPPPPPPPTGVVITPSGDVSTTPGNPIQFSANVPVNWTAGAGQIDTSGLYTPAPDPTVTNDTVTATSQADATQTATVSVTIAPAA